MNLDTEDAAYLDTTKGRKYIENLRLSRVLIHKSIKYLALTKTYLFEALIVCLDTFRNVLMRAGWLIVAISILNWMVSRYLAFAMSSMLFATFIALRKLNTQIVFLLLLSWFLEANEKDV